MPMKPSRYCVYSSSHNELPLTIKKFVCFLFFLLPCMPNVKMLNKDRQKEKVEHKFFLRNFCILEVRDASDFYCSPHIKRGVCLIPVQCRQEWRREKSSHKRNNSQEIHTKALNLSKFPSIISSSPFSPNFSHMKWILYFFFGDWKKH